MTSDWYTKEDKKRPANNTVILCRYTDRDRRKSWTEYVVCVYYKEYDMFTPIELNDYSLDVDMSLHFDFAWTELTESNSNVHLNTRPKSRMKPVY